MIDSVAFVLCSMVLVATPPIVSKRVESSGYVSTTVSQGDTLWKVKHHDSNPPYAVKAGWTPAQFELMDAVLECTDIPKNEPTQSRYATYKFASAAGRTSFLLLTLTYDQVMLVCDCPGNQREICTSKYASRIVYADLPDAVKAQLRLKVAAPKASKK